MTKVQRHRSACNNMLALCECEFACVLKWNDLIVSLIATGFLLIVNVTSVKNFFSTSYTSYLNKTNYCYTCVYNDHSTAVTTFCLNFIGTSFIAIFRDFWSTQASFFLTPIGRYSLGMRMFKISVAYDFTLARYAE